MQFKLTRNYLNNMDKQYGFDIRRTYYKEMTILYTIEDANVYIIRIMPQSLIIF